jgi:leucyl/phenylalanyl-tRNA--protein transferase
LNWHLARWGFAFNDGKLMTPTCRDMGFREIPRGEYLRGLAWAERQAIKPGRWQIETDLKTVAGWQPG